MLMDPNPDPYVATRRDAVSLKSQKQDPVFSVTVGLSGEVKGVLEASCSSWPSSVATSIRAGPIPGKCVDKVNTRVDKGYGHREHKHEQQQQQEDRKESVCVPFNNRMGNATWPNSIEQVQSVQYP